MSTSSEKVAAYLYLGKVFRQRKTDRDAYRHALDAYAALTGQDVDWVHQGLVDQEQVWSGH